MPHDYCGLCFSNILWNAWSISSLTFILFPPFNQSMTDGIEVSFQPPMDETDKKVLIGLAVEMRVPVFLFYKVSALILQVLPLAV